MNNIDINSRYNEVDMTSISVSSLKDATKEATSFIGKLLKKKVYQVGVGEFRALTSSEAKKMDNAMLLTTDKINDLRKAVKMAADSVGRPQKWSYTSKKLKDLDFTAGQSPTPMQANKIDRYLNTYLDKNKSFLKRAEAKAKIAKTENPDRLNDLRNRKKMIDASVRINSAMIQSEEKNKPNIEKAERIKSAMTETKQIHELIKMNKFDEIKKMVPQPPPEQTKPKPADRADIEAEALKKRESIINNMISNEKAFQEKTEAMITVYSKLVEKLEKEDSANGNSANESDCDEIRKIIADLQKMTAVQNKLISGLESWDANSQKPRMMHVANVLQENLNNYKKCILPLAKNLNYVKNDLLVKNHAKLLQDIESEIRITNPAFVNPSPKIFLEAITGWTASADGLNENTLDNDPSKNEIQLVSQLVNQFSHECNEMLNPLAAVKYRNQVIDELITTETTFHENTIKMIEIYKKLVSNLENNKSVFTYFNKSDINEIRTLIEQMEQMEIVQKALIQALTSWDSKSKTPRQVHIANALRKNLDNYNNCILPLVINQEKYSALALKYKSSLNLIEKSIPDPIIFVQRMPRWVLLTYEMIKYTPKNDKSEKKITSIYQRIKTAVDNINTLKAEDEKVSQFEKKRKEYLQQHT